MSSRKKSVLTTPNVEEKIRSFYEAFERNDEMKLMLKFDQYVCTISLNLEMYFVSRSHGELVLVLVSVNF